MEVRKPFHPIVLNFGLCDLPFDLAQGGEPVERLVEPFVICLLAIVI